MAVVLPAIPHQQRKHRSNAHHLFGQLCFGRPFHAVKANAQGFDDVFHAGQCQTHEQHREHHRRPLVAQNTPCDFVAACEQHRRAGAHQQRKHTRGHAREFAHRTAAPARAKLGRHAGTRHRQTAQARGVNDRIYRIHELVHTQPLRTGEPAQPDAV